MEVGEAEAQVFGEAEEEAGAFRKRGKMEGVSEKKTLRSARRRRLELGQMRSDAGVGAAKRMRGRREDPRSLSESSTSSSRWGGSLPSPASNTEAAPPPRFPCPSHGSVSVIGRRREMEDAVTVAPAFDCSSALQYDFFGVYDGHGGARVALACQERMHVVLAEEVRRLRGSEDEGEQEDGWWKEAMVASFARVDGEVANAAAGEGAVASGNTVGSTAVVAVVGARRIVVANCGDSRVVLSRSGGAVPLSADHKPDRPDEMERVEAAGGRVINWNGYRVLGDCYLKPCVSSEPEITIIDRTDKDEFLILATDGLWDVIANDVACKIVRNCLGGRAASIFPDTVQGSTAADAAAMLAEIAMSQGSRDNISVIVVDLRHKSRSI